LSRNDWKRVIAATEEEDAILPVNGGHIPGMKGARRTRQMLGDPEHSTGRGGKRSSPETREVSRKRE